MKEVFFHLFVWIASPACIGATAFYGLLRREYVLGALASAFVLIFCMAAASVMFDGHLLSYGFLYGAYSLIPAIMFVIVICSGVSSAFTFFTKANAKPVVRQADTHSADVSGVEI